MTNMLEKSVSEGHQISHEVKDRIILEIPRVLDVQIHIEPCEFKTEKQA
ncbi:MAG: cation transporter dimerization domain-containing protein [Kiritimatiellia bacterium]